MLEMEEDSKKNIEVADSVYNQNKILLEERDRFLNQARDLIFEK
jgi:hypothetical protein